MRLSSEASRGCNQSVTFQSGSAAASPALSLRLWPTTIIVAISLGKASSVGEMGGCSTY